MAEITIVAQDNRAETEKAMAILKSIKPKRKLFIFFGLGLIGISLYLFWLFFYPVILAEVQFRFQFSNSQEKSAVVKEDFEIIIPKINLQSRVLPEINPFNKTEYLNALSKGVAHAKGSALPGEEGNIFIFGHSTDVPFNVARLNAVFYLINKLRPGDEIKLSYNGKGYKYIVNSTIIIGAKEVNYLQNNSKSRTLTLMTCWPPGTTFKRLLVTSLLID